MVEQLSSLRSGHCFSWSNSFLRFAQAVLRPCTNVEMVPPRAPAQCSGDVRMICRLLCHHVNRGLVQHTAFVVRRRRNLLCGLVFSGVGGPPNPVVLYCYRTAFFASLRPFLILVEQLCSVLTCLAPFSDSERPPRLKSSEARQYRGKRECAPHEVRPSGAVGASQLA